MKPLFSPLHRAAYNTVLWFTSSSIKDLTEFPRKMVLTSRKYVLL
jgi:hypothetical protein